MKEEPSLFFPIVTSSSGDGPITTSSSSAGDNTDTGPSYISSKTTELALSALNYLYPSYPGEPQHEREGQPQHDQTRLLTTENAAQQRTIEELTRKMDELTSSNETNTESSKLCERILAKAESDNVAFRTQIQKLRDENEEIKRAADLKEKANKRCFGQMRKILCEKGSEMKIDVFGDGNSCLSGSSGSSKDKVNIMEALQTILLHMEERNRNLHSNIASLEANLSKSEVALKMTQSKNHALQGEKDSIAKRHSELERKAAIMGEEKVTVQTGLCDLKDRVSTLSVINQSLQEQIDAMANSQVKQENAQFRSELASLNVQLAQMKEDKNKAVQLQLQYDHQAAAEAEEKVESLLEKNRSLKDTILLNNEKYSKKVQELGVKYSSLEKANNEELRQKRSNSGTQPNSMRVHLEGENKLLYEV